MSTMHWGFLRSAVATALATLGLTAAAFAHSGHDHQRPDKVPRLQPATILQLDAVHTASARFLDVDQATQEGYVDIGLFIPNMGWHYLNTQLLDERFDADKPELLVYADDPCGGKRHLVAVEYAVPLDLSKRAPNGFIGRADEWAVNNDFQLWTLHAWLWEYNPDGVFAPMNPRVP